jgi:hypothetical protein
MIVAFAVMGAAAESLNLDAKPNGIGGFQAADRPEAVRLAPEPVQLGNQLKMAHLDLAVEPASVSFMVGTDKRFGPYPLVEGTPFGTSKPPFKLVKITPYGFSVEAPNGTVYGPFSKQNGSPVELGKTMLHVMRFPPSLKVSLDSDGTVRRRPSIGIAPLDNDLLKDLNQQRTICANALNRMLADSASVQLQGMPIIHNSITGNDSGNVVSVSKRDKQNAAWMAERTAVLGFENLFAKRFRIRPQAITDNGTVFRFGMPAGNYILLAMQKVQDRNAPSLQGAKTLIWWTAFAFDGEQSYAVALTPENSVTWQDVFGFERVEK